VVYTTRDFPYHITNYDELKLNIQRTAQQYQLYCRAKHATGFFFLTEAGKVLALCFEKGNVLVSLTYIMSSEINNEHQEM